MKEFWLCFVPLFVAVDAIGVLPIFMGLTEGLEKARVQRTVAQSVVTAMAVALAFLAVGKLVLRFLSVTVSDFLIAGGVVLFVISISDMLSTEKRRRYLDVDSLGAVPLGVPLIVGPAVLTTSLILLDAYGAVATVSATVANIAIAGVVFWTADPINRMIGRSGSKAVSKVASLLLAAIAVKMVRRGILMLIAASASGALQ